MGELSGINTFTEKYRLIKCLFYLFPVLLTYFYICVIDPETINVPCIFPKTSD